MPRLLPPLDQQASLLAQRGIPDDIATLAQLGTEHLMYVPWMQATYIMAANKQALPYLPAGRDTEHADLRAARRSGRRTREKRPASGARLPAGPKGLMQRFFEGYLLPSYTGGVVVTFRVAGGRDDVDGVPRRCGST